MHAHCALDVASCGAVHRFEDAIYARILMNIKSKLQALRKKGMSLRMIAEKVGMSYTGVRHHVKDIEPVYPPKTRDRRPPGVLPPIPLPPSTALAHLIGVIAGDGFIERKARTYRLWITCGNDHPELITKYEILVRKLLPGNVKIRPRPNSACTDITLYGCHLPYLLGIRAGAKNDGAFPIPAWIFQADEYMAAFMRGLIETDGGVYHRFTPTNKHYVHCSFTTEIDGVKAAFLHSTKALGFEFKPISRKLFQLAKTVEVEQFLKLSH